MSPFVVPLRPRAAVKYKLFLAYPRWLSAARQKLRESRACLELGRAGCRGSMLNPVHQTLNARSLVVNGQTVIHGV